MTNPNDSKHISGYSPLTEAAKQRNIDGLASLAEQAAKAQTDYAEHVAICGLCERELPAARFIPVSMLSVLKKAARLGGPKGTAFIHCAEGWQLALDAHARSAVFGMARTTLKALGIGV